MVLYNHKQTVLQYQNKGALEAELVRVRQCSSRQQNLAQ